MSGEIGRRTKFLMVTVLVLALMVGCSPLTGVKGGTPSPQDGQNAGETQIKPGKQASLEGAKDNNPMEKVSKPAASPTPGSGEPDASLPPEPTPAPTTTADEYENMLADPSLPIEKQVDFYMDRLKDKTYTAVYGDGYTWYTAAEELGKIGKAAIPKLMDRLGTQDDYERALVLYALLLASQHENVKGFANGEYIDVNLDFDPSNHKELVERAKAWWEKYKSHF